MPRYFVKLMQGIVETAVVLVEANNPQLRTWLEIGAQLSDASEWQRTDELGRT
jgi:hypothetical protein